MKTLLNKLTQKDKLLHFAAGVMIYLLLCLFIPSQYALVVTFLVALGKEAYWDMYLGKGNAEALDFFMTIIAPIIIHLIFINA